jgi:hypothetical protein
VSPAAVALVGPWIAALSAAAPPLTLVAQPSDTRCPAPADLAAAVAERVPVEARGWVATYAVTPGSGPSPESELRLELYDRAHRLRLVRQLAIADEGCAAAAEGVALILERFFEEVAWTASVPLPELERLPEPPPVVERRWELQAGTAGRLEIALAPVLALDVRATFRQRWTVAMGLVLQPASDSQAVSSTGGRAEMRSLPLRASLRRGKAAGAVTFEIGPELMLVGEHAATSGLAGDGFGYRLVGAAGVVAGARWALSPAWTVVIEAAGDVTLFGPAFVVTGAGEVLAPSRVQGLALLGLAHAL